MKTMLARTAVAVSVATLSLASVSRVIADEPITSENKIYNGTVAAVDQSEKTVAVKGFWANKKFITSDNCRVSFENRPAASLAELRPGHQVKIHYQNVDGVLVASQIEQHDMVLAGHITAMDPSKRTLVLKTKSATKSFTIAEDCAVLLKDDRVGTPENLKVGHAVKVAYEPEKGSLIARKVEQRSESYVGTIQAIDASARTVKAKSFIAERKFHLADGCRVVIEGKPDAGLKDLRIGDRVAFNYEEADGVLVANRIGRDSALPETEPAQTANVGRTSR